MIVKPSRASKDLDIATIEVELVKIPKSEEEKEETTKSSLKISDFSNQMESVKMVDLEELQKYRIRSRYQHSLGLMSEFGHWKEFSTKSKHGE